MVRQLSSEKRQAFLRAALRLFVENGIQNTTTGQIAQEAGTAAGTLFLYFPTKLELVNALAISLAQAQSEAIRAQLEPSFSAREMFLAIWNGTVRWFLGDLAAFQYTQQVRDSGLILPETVLETGKSFAYYYEAIQKGQSEGSIQPYPADLIGEFLYEDLIAVMKLLQRQPDPALQGEIVRQGFSIFWDGIKK